MSAPPDRLTQSAQKALSFAWAAAQERGRAESSPEPIDSWDLLVGMLLSHPGSSEGEQAFRHFGLTAGHALPDAYPRLTPQGLNSRLSLMSPEFRPPLTPDVEEILDLAARISVPGSADDLVPLRSLWSAILDGPSEAGNRIRTLLGGLGVDTSHLAAETRNWIQHGSPDPYARVLEQFRTAPLDVINYKADQGTTGAEAISDDYIGISAEVDAFAYLIASHDLQPPLAIGLFGDWGSGKSYFLNALRRRIDQLVSSDGIRDADQRDIPFWKRIVQVDFNAWHYVDGDLWSSLVDHIFTQLDLASDDASGNEVARRQRFYLEQMDTTKESLKHLKEQREQTKRDLEQQSNEVANLKQQRHAALEELRDARAHKTARAQTVTNTETVKKALAGVHLQPEIDGLTIGDALSALSAARQDLSRGRALLQPLDSNPGLHRTGLISLVLAVIVPALVGWIVDSGAIAAVAGLASLLAAATRILILASRQVRQQLDEVDRATREVRREERAAEDVWRTRVQAAEQQVHDVSDRLAALTREEDQLVARLQLIDKELSKPPQQILHDFLKSRLAAGDYRSRLGVPALIRRDFSSLADLVSHQNAFLLAPNDAKKRLRREHGDTVTLLEPRDPLIINRIVLYIDDLDRCPDDKVVDVLQAVHLLLAFPLFVVVVAVDSRWLAHALKARYPALAGSLSTVDDAASPEDYLEKIFQVPFWVQDLDSAGRRRIIDGLLGGHLKVESPPGGMDERSGLVVGEAEARVLKDMIDPRSRPPLLDATALTLSNEDLIFLNRLAPLMGNTPRSIKRFVNVYQLIRIVRRSRRQREAYPSDDELCAFLLAIGDGLPDIAWQLLDGPAVESGKTLGALLDKPGLTWNRDERERMKAWLDTPENTSWMSLPVERIRAAAPDVRRFLFRVSPHAR